ncbi:MAG: HD domain-containing protein [Candidatus Methanosuratincola sp.]
MTSNTGPHDPSYYTHAIHYIEVMCKAAFEDIGSHGWEHVERVRTLCKIIGKKEGADLLVLDLAALFHDVMRTSEDHALQSAEFARSVLSTMGFGDDICAAVYEAIASHSYSSGRSPKSLEAKVLSDADKLDAMGATGIYRTIQYNTERALPPARILEHIKKKLLNLPQTLQTDSAKEIAKKRIPIMEHYLHCLEEELLETSISK